MSHPLSEKITAKLNGSDPHARTTITNAEAVEIRAELDRMNENYADLLELHESNIRMGSVPALAIELDHEAEYAHWLYGGWYKMIATSDHQRAIECLADAKLYEINDEGSRDRKLYEGEDIRKAVLS